MQKSELVSKWRNSLQFQGNAQKKSFRYTGLDGYRFLAASFVVLYHYNEFFGLGLDKFDLQVGRLPLMVDFFFVLSGFVIAEAYFDRMESGADYLTFLRSRLGRIYPLHLLTLAGFVVMAGIGAALHIRANNPEDLSLLALPANLFLEQAWGALDHNSFNVPSWSISAEWFLYLLAPLLFWLARRASPAASILLVLTFVVAMAQCRAAFGMRAWTLATYDLGALRALPSFFVGLLVARAVSATPRRDWARWWMAQAIFVAAVLAMQFGAPVELVVALFAALVAMAAICERNGRKSWIMSAPARALGDASFAIYMLHGLLCVPVLFVLRKHGLLGSPTAVLAACATFVIVVALSIASHRYFEIPAQRWLISVLGKRKLLGRA